MPGPLSKAASRLADISQIGDTADIDENGGRFEPVRQIGGKRHVIGRDQRRALPAMYHVVGAHVIDHIDAGFLCQQQSVTDLHGQCLIRPVQHRLAMKTNDVDIAGFKPVTVQEGFHRRRMGKRQLALGLAQIARTLTPFADGLGCR